MEGVITQLSNLFSGVHLTVLIMRIKGQGDQNLRQLKAEWIKDTSSSYQERPMDMSYTFKIQV